MNLSLDFQLCFAFVFHLQTTIRRQDSGGCVEFSPRSEYYESRKPQKLVLAILHAFQLSNPGPLVMGCLSPPKQNPSWRSGPGCAVGLIQHRHGCCRNRTLSIWQSQNPVMALNECIAHMIGRFSLH